MVDVNELIDVIEKIEHQFRHHGLWLNPYIPPPKINIRDDWDEGSRVSAEVLNRIFWIRSMPDCSRLFGPVRESAIEAFLYDYGSGAERINYARNQLNLLIADLGLLRSIETSGFTRIQE